MSTTIFGNVQLIKIFRCCCIASTLFSIIGKSEVLAHRRSATTSDSILEIINTQEVERLLASRRLNSSRPDRRYMAQNDLDDESLDGNPQTIAYDTADPASDFEKRKSRDNNNRIGVDILMRQYNASSPLQPQEVLAELAAYNGQKLLKSSKNAFVVTRKEYLKKDWCKTEPLVQRIKEEGCLTRTIINKFCYGQCNSFYIPKNPKRRRTRQQLRPDDERDDVDQNGAAFKSCAFCKPKKFMWITVTLRCPSLNPPYKKKRIQRIKQCKCTSVDVN
ncbi:uncharacterized protein LOC143911935 isoform X2 [Arctopsyche grandis]